MVTQLLKFSIPRRINVRTSATTDQQHAHRPRNCSRRSRHYGLSTTGICQQEIQRAPELFAEIRSRSATSSVSGERYRAQPEHQPQFSEPVAPKFLDRPARTALYWPGRPLTTGRLDQRAQENTPVTKVHGRQSNSGTRATQQRRDPERDSIRPRKQGQRAAALRDLRNADAEDLARSPRHQQDSGGIQAAVDTGTGSR